MSGRRRFLAGLAALAASRLAFAQPAHNYIHTIWRQAADVVDKILKGAKPANLPVEQPSKFELLLNLAAAKAIGLALPRSVVLRADELIQ